MALQIQQQVNVIMGSLSTGMAWRLFYALIVMKAIAPLKTLAERIS